MMRAAATRRPGAQRGAAALEFALGAMIFFSFIFFMIELSRAFYLWNSLIEITHGAARTAAHKDFSATTQLAVRSDAILTDRGGLKLRGNLSPANLKIEYLNGNLARVATPACAEANMAACVADPGSATCVRFVRVRLCDPLNTTDPSGCGRVTYVPLISTGLVPAGTFQFPRFDSITPAGTFGYRPGTAGTCQ